MHGATSNVEAPAITAFPLDQSLSQGAGNYPIQSVLQVNTATHCCLSGCAWSLTVAGSLHTHTHRKLVLLLHVYGRFCFGHD